MLSLILRLSLYYIAFYIVFNSFYLFIPGLKEYIDLLPSVDDKWVVISRSMLIIPFLAIALGETIMNATDRNLEKLEKLEKCIKALKIENRDKSNEYYESFKYPKRDFAYTESDVDRSYINGLCRALDLLERCNIKE